MCIGRPTAVIDSDHDTQSPDLDDDEDIELLHLTAALEPHVSTIRSSLAMACLRARIQLGRQLICHGCSASLLSGPGSQLL